MVGADDEVDMRARVHLDVPVRHCVRAKPRWRAESEARTTGGVFEEEGREPLGLATGVRRAHTRGGSGERQRRRWRRRSF